MKILTNRKLTQKVIISIVCMLLLNFCIVPTKVQAVSGGELLQPIKDFVVFIGDVAITLIQYGFTGKWTYAVDDAGTGQLVFDDNATEAEKKEIKDKWKKEIKYPIIQISPELIFANQVELLNIDFIGGSEEHEYVLETSSSATSTLRKVIAEWYVALRTLAMVGLLSVLIYIGIKIIISSSSQDKAKYKQRIVDWIVAFCLLFFMHYIMAGTISVVNRIDQLLSGMVGITDENGKIILDGVNQNQEYGKVKYEPIKSIGSVSSNPIENLINMFKGYDKDRKDAMKQVQQVISDNGYTLIREEPEPDEDTGSPYSDIGDISSGWVITDKEDPPLMGPGRLQSVST